MAREQAIGCPIRSARTRAVYDQMPITLATPAIVACLTGSVLLRAVDPDSLSLWVSSILALTVLRFGLWLAHRRERYPEEREAFWRLATLAGSTASGIAWGLGAALLFPQEQVYQLFLAFVVGGLCAGSVTVNSSYMPSVLAFVWPATVPLACRFLSQESAFGLASGAMTLVFAGALSLTAQKFHNFFGDVFELQAALQERTRELYSANARLQAEMAEHQATETSLRQLQKMEAIGRLTAGIAHDFNNLLTIILAAVERLLKIPPPNGWFAARIAAIHEAAVRGARLTRQLAAFAGKQVLTPQTVDLNALLRGMERLLNSAVESVDLRLELAGDLWAVDVDPGQIEQAVLNLVINARDAVEEAASSPDGSRRDATITIETKNVEFTDEAGPTNLPAGQYVAIVVVDIGCGMTEEVLAQVFDPFFTTKSPLKGSGLGLSQVYGIVQQSGGATDIQSKPGMGTRVALYFPRSHHKATMPIGVCPQ